MPKTSPTFLTEQAHQAADPFRLLVESVVDYAIYMVDPGGLIASWNSGAERIYGYSAEEIIGQPFSTVYTVEELANGRPELMWKTAVAERHYEFECMRRRKDNSLFLAVVTTSYLQDHLGNHAGFGVVTRDITEKRGAELALKESEERHRRLLDVLPDAVFVNSGGRVVYGNNSFAQLLEANDSRELLNRDCLSIFHPKYHDAIRQRIEALHMNGGTAPLLEEAVVSPSGEVVPVEVTATAIIHEGQKATLVILRDLRQRKEVETRFRAMIDGITDYAIYTLNVEGAITAWNDGATRTFGFTADEIVGRHRTLLFTAEDVTAGVPQDELKRAAATGKANEERWRIRKDGSRFWANGVMTAVRDELGALRGYVKIVRDLTERKQAEAALQESEERYRTLFNAVADPLFVYDRETLAYLAVNDAAVRSYGYSRDEYSGMTIKDIRPVEEVVALLEMLAESGTGLEHRGIWRHQRKDGSIMEVEITAHGLEYAGRPACVIEARDVTEKRQAEAKAARANDLLRAVVQATPDAMFVKDLNGEYLLFNPAASSFVGKPSEEVIGRDDTALFTLESAKIIRERDRQVIESNQANTEEEQLTAAGHTRTYLATKIPFQNSEGNVIGVLGISRDITDQKRVEETLRQQQMLLRIAGRVARLGGWSLDLLTNEIRWSDEICEIHDEPIGTQPQLADGIRYFVPEHRERVAHHVHECSTHGTPFDFEYEMVTAKGRRIWVRSIGEAVRNDSGGIVGLQGAFQDISDRKATEAETHRLAERLTTTLESITDGFFTLDREWHFTYVNAEAERLTKRRREELIGILLWDAFPEALGSTFEREYRRAHSEQTTVDFEEFFPPLDKWFGVRAYPSEQGLAVYFRDVTMSRKAEQALKASEALFRTVIQSSWDVFHLVEPNGIITYESPAVTRVLGYLPEEMVGHHIGDFVHPDDLFELSKSNPDHLATPYKQRTVVLRVRHKDGSWRWVESYEVNLSDHPDVRAVAVNYRDITDRKRAEESLLHRDRAIQQVSQGIVITDPKQHDNPIIYASPGMERMTGYSSDEMIGRNCRMLQGQDTDPEAIRKLHEAIAKSEKCKVELLNYRKDGTPFWNELSVNPVNDVKGKPSYFVGVQNDVTERKLLEADRDQLLAQLQLQIERMPLAYLLSDADFRYTRWNPTAERMFGYTQDEVLGKHPFEVIVPTSAQPFVASLFEKIKAGSMDSHGECENQTKSGKVIVCEWHNTPMFDFNGNFVGLMSLAKDITERKQLENQYRQSQKMEAVGRLAGGIAHDFNNLLTIISGYSELVLAAPGVGDEVLDSVKEISEAGTRAAALTQQLLGFSRQTLLQPKVLDLNTVVTETGKMLRRLIGEDILFTTVLDPKVGLVKVDPGQLDQVLMNLAVNARDAMPKGGKLTIETMDVHLSDDYVTTHPDCKAGHHVLLAMSDTGCGMTPEVMTRIFEPFYTTKEVGLGTGLGLAMVFGIIQQSGGCIHVYSEPNRGTTFKIYLPAVAEQIVVKRSLDSQLGLKGTETIVLVEDDEGVRGLAFMSLKKYGYHVLTATDGKDAIRVLKAYRGQLHLILTDVVMPNVSGPELIESIRPDFPDVKVLYMSGYTDDAVVRHGLIEAEMSFIQKPYTPMGLVRKVREVLDAKSYDKV